MRCRAAYLLPLAVSVALACEPQSGEAVPPELLDPALGAVVSPGFVPGDEFEVRVYGEEELSGPFQVQDDGTIVFPLLDEVKVEGLSQAELAELLEKRLADGYLNEPNVTVVVKSRENVEISVLGEVSKPGSFPYAEQLTLIQAVSNAGGLTKEAAPRRVRLTRKMKDGPRTFEVDLKAVQEGRAPDFVLLPGDIVYVPISRI